VRAGLEDADGHSRCAAGSHEPLPLLRREDRDAAVPSETLATVEQFGTRTVRVDRTSEYCNPVEKRRDGRPAEPIVRPGDHLTCIRISTFTPGFSARSVFTRDQFSLETVRVVASRRLCAPATKLP
jgi:hypothetical protein